MRRQPKRRSRGSRSCLPRRRTARGCREAACGDRAAGGEARKARRGRCSSRCTHRSGLSPSTRRRSKPWTNGCASLTAPWAAPRRAWARSRDRRRILAGIARGIEGVSKRFEDLLAQSDELTRRQLALDRLHEQLADVDALAKKTSWQMDWLRQGREDMEALRKDVLEFQESHANVAQLRADLAADRQALQAFGERMTAVSARTPELEAKVDGILAKMSLVESASQQAVRLKELMSTLDGQVARLEARASLVETIEAAAERAEYAQHRDRSEARAAARASDRFRQTQNRRRRHCRPDRRRAPQSRGPQRAPGAVSAHRRARARARNRHRFDTEPARRDQFGRRRRR